MTAFDRLIDWLFSNVSTDWLIDLVFLDWKISASNLTLMASFFLLILAARVGQNGHHQNGVMRHNGAPPPPPPARRPTQLDRNAAAVVSGPPPGRANMIPTGMDGQFQPAVDVQQWQHDQLHMSLDSGINSAASTAVNTLKLIPFLFSSTVSFFPLHRFFVRKTTKNDPINFIFFLFSPAPTTVPCKRRPRRCSRRAAWTWTVCCKWFWTPSRRLYRNMIWLGISFFF